MSRRLQIVRRRLRRLPPVAWDALIAAALAAGSVVEVFTITDAPGPRWVNLTAVLLICVAVLLRRVTPVAAAALWLAAVLGMVLCGATPTSYSTPFLSLFLIPYATASRLPARLALLTLAMLWAGLFAVWLSDPDRILGDLFFPGSFMTVFWVAGRAVRGRSELTAELHELAVRAGEARELEATRAVREERRRIARELHDVVGHSVSMMVVQAGGARRILERDPARAVAAAELIERTGREALAEMRRLLGVLHAEDHAAPEYAPQPTLRELDALVQRARGAGVPVALVVDGEHRELPVGLDLAAYRVVQEALTNVVKHGGGAPTEVRIHYGADAVEVRIADRGRGGAAERLDGGGHGLVGMRERVRMYGGELHAGRRSGGGFEVRAVLPLEDEPGAALTAGARA